MSTIESLHAVDAAVPESLSEPESQPASWPFAKRFALYSAFVFFLLVNWPFPLYFIPYAGQFIISPVGKMWHALVPFVATSIFHVDASVRPNGSGDTTYNYVQLAIWVTAGLLLGALWAAITRKRAHTERIYEAFHIYLRFTLASTMVSYGVVKVIQLQFPQPWLERLVQPYGTSSPMGILWTFMGVSRAYNFITGAAEMLAGVLLTTRRTTLLGSLLAIVVMGNIVALNFCYDVPVKLYSSELLLMALIIATPYARRLLELFLRTRHAPLFRRTWLETTSLVVRTLLVTAYLAYSFYDAAGTRKTFGDLAPRSPLRGIWNVDELIENGASRPPLVTDLTRWRRVVFDHPQYMSILLMSDTRVRFRQELDEKKHLVTLTNRDDPKQIIALGYTRPDPKTLVLDTVVDGKKVHATCHLSSQTANLLMTRGFHWVNETPFNR